FDPGRLRLDVRNVYRPTCRPQWSPVRGGRARLGAREADGLLPVPEPRPPGGARPREDRPLVHPDVGLRNHHERARSSRGAAGPRRRGERRIRARSRDLAARLPSVRDRRRGPCDPLVPSAGAVLVSGPEKFGGFFHFFGKGDFKGGVPHLLQDAPMHGYEVIKAIEERYHGFYKPSAGAIYPALRALLRKAYLSVSGEERRK